MFNSVATRLTAAAVKFSVHRRPFARKVVVPKEEPHTHFRTNLKHYDNETDQEFDCRYEAYFNRTDIDGWEVRHAMNELSGMDMVPDTKIIIAALHACRRINDYAVAIRFLETVKFKCADKVHVIWPYVLQEIRPTLHGLGLETPEELGYDKPELMMPDIYEYPTK
uniref:Cytochrome c oxidase subunit 5A, mitochondrial n=1 Tax=Timema genevievae TaxID=629358 RepID=A0A7R9K1G0_TIMGE|nr:unnamed protein product [Timema genevievae]